MKYMFHISDFKKYERCPRMFWLSRKQPKSFVPFISYNMSMIELCKELLMISDAFEGMPNDDSDLAQEALKTHKWLLNARFAYEDLRVKVPILLQEDGKRIAYFPFSTCYPKENEAVKIADTLAVLALLKITIDEVYCIHLHADYIRGESLEVRELLLIEDFLFNSKNKPGKKLSVLLPRAKRDVLELLAEVRECEQQALPPAIRSNACTRGLKCLYFEDCFPTKIEDTSILNLVQSAHKYEMKEEGIHDLKDVDVNRIEGTRHQYAQIMAAKHGRYVDQAALRCWIKDHITYPLSYLDFEWETFAFPPYVGMKPFDVLCFQYSLHIEEEKGAPLQHVGFLKTQDCRRAFVESLLKEVPKKGSILVYNMEGAEKLRLRQLAQQFPEYEKQLEAIWERMVDLSLPFSTGNVYDNRMAGFYSLKTLVPIFSEYNYQDLSISYGMGAVESFRQLENGSFEEQQTIKQQLDEYCAMDTYAEYIVFHALEKLAMEE